MNENNIAIRVNGLGKMYRIGKKKKYEKNWRKKLSSLGVVPFEWLINQMRGPTEEEILWSLRDVSFEVKRGEVLGIIGQNGAGKSTLLKILSHITEPSKGYADISGRVASLLEVGTGMHPELTGRENTYLNGTILGMKKMEIDKKFDEIVEFADISKFIDTPVKRYSSGMRVRLGFAIAAHLEPEILLIDEVLAVGDAAFQKKCLGKINDVASHGRTILFVSHKMASVQSLCDKVIWLKDGSIFDSGEAISITEAYLRQTVKAQTLEDIPKLISKLPPDANFKLLGVDIQQGDKLVNCVFNDEPIVVEIIYEVLRRSTGLRVYFDLLDDSGDILIRSFHDEDAVELPTMESGVYCSRGIIPGRFLSPRTYELRVRTTLSNVRSCVGSGVGIELSVQHNAAISRAYAGVPIRSKLLPKFNWSTKKLR